MSATPSATEAASGSDCPKCGAPQQAGQTSFCGECGYSERLGRNGDLGVEETIAGPSQAGLIVFAIGIVLIPLVAAAIRCYLWEAPGVSLSAWLFWTCSIGGGMALVGHLMGWGVCVAQSGMDLTDVVCSPIRIWGMVFRSLPKGITALCLFGFGLAAAAFGGLAFGVDYEAMVRKAPVDTRDTLMSIVNTVRGLVPDLSALGAGADELTGEDADASLLFGDADATSPVSIASTEVSVPAEPLLRQSASCLVIGYVEGGDGELEALVLALPENDSIKYAGTVSIGDVEPAAFDELVAKSLSLTQAQPVIECPIEAKWLTPDAVCRVDFAGRSKSGELTTPHMVEVTEHLSAAE